MPRERSPKPAHERFSQHQQPGGVRSGKRWNVVQGRKEDQRGVGKDGERSPKVPTRPEESPNERTKCRPRDDTQAEQPQEGGEGRNARQRKPGQQGGVTHRVQRTSQRPGGKRNGGGPPPGNDNKADPEQRGGARAAPDQRTKKQKLPRKSPRKVRVLFYAESSRLKVQHFQP